MPAWSPARNPPRPQIGSTSDGQPTWQDRLRASARPTQVSPPDHFGAQATSAFHSLSASDPVHRDEGSRGPVQLRRAR
jgi:hypothetical protein